MSYKYYYKKKLQSDISALNTNTNNYSNSTELLGPVSSAITTAGNQCSYYFNTNYVVDKMDHKEFLDLRETTLEGQYISCYLVNSEPRLCLSQILSKVLIYFSIETIRDKFFELGIHCYPCTPMQLQMFKSRCLLPTWANLCGLISKSNAERLCLDLFNMVVPNKRLDYDSILQIGNPFGKYDENNSYYFNCDEKNHDLYIAMLLSRGPMNYQHALRQLPMSTLVEVEKNDNLLYQDEPINYTSKKNSINSGKKGDIDHFNSTKYHCLSEKALALASTRTSQSIHPSLVQADYRNLKNFLHEIERHRALNSLVSSSNDYMLSIRVYHRCVGKCTGLYYPAFYHSPSSQVIECIKCHYLFSPKRFIGHTHGTKESNICHWGLDSHKWRCYIRLSRTQQTNHLEEQKLVNIYHDLQNRFEYIVAQNRPQPNDSGKNSQINPSNGCYSKRCNCCNSKGPCVRTKPQSCDTEDFRVESEMNTYGNKRVKLLDCVISNSRSSKIEYNSKSRHIPSSQNGINPNRCHNPGHISIRVGENN